MIFKRKKKEEHIQKVEMELNNSIDKSDFNSFELSVFNDVKDYTMTSIERVVSLIRSVDYVIKNNLPGDIIECGVWKGGSAMTIIKTLINLGVKDRKIYLYDTFEGMPPPDLIDKTFDEVSANDLMINTDKSTSVVWAYSELDEVKFNISSLNYPTENIFYVQGKVEDTLINNEHDQISLLRLDTDWYSSTKIELELLFPKLVRGGVLLIDDYGHWQGAKKAVDEYLKVNNIPFLLNRIDYTGRIGVKI